MKLQNLLYATMVACAFSACSNDDDPNIPDPVLEMDATLTAVFNSVGNGGSSLKSLTKAGDDANFSTVNTIGIAVFNDGAMGSAMASGTLISYQQKNNEADTTACVSVKSGKVKVLVIANPANDMFKDQTTLDGFIGTISKVAINSGELLMSSKVYSLTLSTGRNVMVNDRGASVFSGNTTDEQVKLSENVKVYRNVARVEVPNITVNPREGFGKGKTATFTLKKIFVANVRPSVRVAGTSEGENLYKATTGWCSVVDGTSSLLKAGETESSAAYYKVFNQNISYSNNEGGKKETIDDAQLFVYDNASHEVIGTPKDNATLLVIKGDYEYTTDAGSTVKSEDAYWTVAINNDALTSGDKDFPQHCGVLRNVKYVMNVTITGPGSATIDPGSNAASLTAKIEVVNWGEVVLNPDID